ncbi:hypothetical protein A3A48_04115 [Candidatus Curtissbacteria bacterium RIFCSPLOWO2_01_FULL_37_9]|uniref:Uncharacterized protein n=1 Tax=Candidatus Curtissbacteria bacterium RIFCSPLOWO2_01_FULL_37_9 TaxID=1797724 RepID=A0A1F5GTV4_9BACT|nr:MAG: hypothetical protein A3A48_04115 [Candidatus Curtissbacteria bacterium RIFCSPLOWO2_01_FULL_37_9]
MDGDNTEKPTNGVENAYDSLNVPRKNELSVGEITSRSNARMREAIATNKSWSPSEVKDQLKAEADFEELKLRAPVEIAKGQNIVLAAGGDAGNALATLFDSSTLNFIMRPYYALIETTDGENPRKIEASFKYLPVVKPKTPNHLIVSEALAKELGITDESEIRVTDVYQKALDLDLDNPLS